MQSSQSNSNANNVFLKGPEDWEDWDLKFQAQAVSKRLWDQIKHSKPFLKDPKEPIIADYRLASQQASTQSTSTRRAASQSTAASQATPATAEEVTFADLQSNEKADFNFAWTMYQAQKKDYNTQIEAIDKMRDWVTKTVDSKYYRVSCKPTESIKDWYDKLKESAGVSDLQSRNDARDAYKQAIKPLTRVPKDLPAWATAWEHAISAAKEKGVAAAQTPAEWFEDFITAVRPIMEHWAASYRLVKAKEVEEGSLTYRTLANDFREEVRLQTKASKPSRVAKGSFGPSFAGQEDQRASVDVPQAGDGDGGQQAGSKRGRKPGKRKQPDDILSGSKACRACQLFHPLSRCYYAFPEKAPEGFRERKDRREAVELALKEDPTLAEEIKRMGKKKEVLDQDQD